MNQVATETAPDAKTSEEGGGLSAYLQAPRKKRKNFVIIATGPKFDSMITGKIVAFIKKTYPGLAVSQPKNTKELSRQFSRNIALLLIDDQFDDLEIVIQSVSALKLKTKKTELAPVLFLTKEPTKLVQNYQEKLAAHQEIDDYCDISKLTIPQLIGRVKVGIENKNRRKARRYKVNINVMFHHLTKGTAFQGMLIDLSINGGMISSADVGQFKLNDQLRLSIPSRGYLDISDGEFLHVSAKIRRVFVAGSTAAFSFEHITDLQMEKLTKIVARIAREQFVR